MSSLSDRLQDGEVLLAPGVFDALSARLAECAGFPLAFLSGSAMSYAQLARPDAGLLTSTDVALTLDKICDRVTIPVMVDVDSGFGNSINAYRTVRTLERAGAAGIQIEDQQSTKQPADLFARPLVSTEEMVGKIKASLDARQKSTTLISARTDALYTEGFDAAIDRVHEYLEAGADLIFIEGMRDQDQLVRARSEFERRIPLVYNCECGGRGVTFSGEELRRAGYQVLLYPGVLVRAMAAAGAQALGQLIEASGAQPDLADILAADEFLRRFRSA